MNYARIHIAAWVDEYNQQQPHSTLGYETPVAFAAELHKRSLAVMRDRALI